MKKLFSLVCLIFSIGVGATYAQAKPIDLIVLVDTSESMLPYWQDTSNYIIKNILTGVLHEGDTFHLISFASQPELEISRKIESEKDIQAILARFLLLQPLGSYTDLVAAIQYLYQYVIDLPLATEKRIVILTDGIHDPPPGSRFPIKYGPNGKDISDNRQLVVETAQAMRRHGWEVHIIQYPISGSTTRGGSQNQPGVQLLGSTQQTGRSVSAAGTTPAPQEGQQRQTARRTGVTAPRASTTALPRRPQTSKSQSSSREGNGVEAAAGAVSQSASGEKAGVGQAGGQRSAAVAQTPLSSTGPAATTGPEGSTMSGEQPIPAGGSSRARGESGLLGELSQTLGVRIQHFESGKKQNLANIATGSPSIRFPANLGSVGYKTTAPFVIHNFQDQPVLVQLSRIIYDGTNILRRPVNQPVGANKEAVLRAPLELPRALAPGSHTIFVELQFSDSLRVSPHTGRLSFTLRKGIIEAQGITSYAVPVLFGVVLLAVLVLIVIFVRRIVGSLGAPSVGAMPRARFDSGRAGLHPIELRVVGQNPSIGGRNIHAVGSGSRRTVGGGSSSFLIYLYPCPAHIGEVSYDGEHYSFTPTRPECFPGLTGELRDCLDKSIRVKPSENHEVMISFRRYVSPLDEVNRIMHLVDKPGASATPAT